MYHSLISPVPETLTRASILHPIFFTVSAILHCMCRTNSWGDFSAALPCRLIPSANVTSRAPFNSGPAPPSAIPHFRGNFLLLMGVSPLPAQSRCLHLLQASQGVLSLVDSLPNAALTSPGTYFVPSYACHLPDFHSSTCSEHPNHLIFVR